MKQNQASRRLSETAREKLSYILLFELADPALSLVSVTGCEVSIDRSFLRAYVSCEPERYEEVLEALNRAKGRIRSLLGRSLGWRVTPELSFEIDTTADEAERIAQALQDVPPTLSVEKDEDGYPVGEHTESVEENAALDSPCSNSPHAAHCGTRDANQTRISLSQVQLDQYLAIKELVEAANRIAICAHTNPDGDAIGSVLGLSHTIRSVFPAKRVDCLLADARPLAANFCYLPGSESFLFARDYTQAPDLFICLDLPEASRLEDAQAVMERSAKVATIDHHPAREQLGNPHIERCDAAAVGVLIAELVYAWSIEMNSDIARCLLCAIATDTGCYQYQNTNSEAFSISSWLVEAGASPSELSLEVYQSNRLGYLQLQARVMSRIACVADGRIAYSWAHMSDLEETSTSVDECDGLIDLVRGVAGAEIALFVRQIEANKVRGNIRAKGSQDISVVARELGGGGHPAASGFSYNGSVDEVLTLALSKLEALLNSEA